MESKSFLNHIGLGFLDPNNNLDKLANSIKDGKVGNLVKVLTTIIGDLEERLTEFKEAMEDSKDKAKRMVDEARDDAKKDVQRTTRRIVRSAVEQGRADLEKLHESFGSTLMEQLKPTISIMVATEVKKRVEADKAKE